MESRNDGIARYVPDVHEFAATRTLGPLTIGEQHFVRLDRESRIEPDRAVLHGMMLLCLPVEGEADLHVGGVRARCPDGGGLLLDLAKRWKIDARPGLRCYTLLVPDVFLALAAPDGAMPGILEPSTELGAIGTLLAGVLRLDEALPPREELLIAGAVQYLLAATFAPSALGDHAVALREVSLLQRTKSHIDRHLATDLSVSAVCTALGCSRSALYRATSPVGGIVELVARSRLAAIYRCLLDPTDDRPISVIASVYGFPRAAHFSRRFRQTFGTTARRVRDARPTPAPIETTLRIRQY